MPGLKVLLPLLLLVAAVSKLFCQVSFLPFDSIATGSIPKVVAVGDLNKNGLNDIIVGTGRLSDVENDNKLFIFYQDSAGKLKVPVKHDIPGSKEGITAIAIADVNQDSLVDIIVTLGEFAGIYYQDSSGIFDLIILIYDAGSKIINMEAGDLNNDGLIDIAIALDTSLVVLYNTGTDFTALSYPKPIGGVNSMEIADLNSNGLMDLVVSGSNSIYLYYQNSSGTFNPHLRLDAPPALNSLHDIATADLNGNGKIDIVASNRWNIPKAHLIIWYQDSLTSSFSDPELIPAHHSPGPLQVADLNCNGKKEIIILNSGWSRYSIYEQDEQGKYEDYTLIYLHSISSSFPPHTTKAADINNDGKIDFIYVIRDFGLVLLYNSSSHTFLPDDTLVYEHLVKSVVNPDSISHHVTTSRVKETSVSYVNRTDSLVLNYIIQYDSFRVDSIFIGRESRCSNYHFDTLAVSTYELRSALLYIDTLTHAVIMDTVMQRVDAEANIYLFPNPAKDRIYIEFHDPEAGKPVVREFRLEIFDVTGKSRFYNQRVRNKTGIYPVDISWLPDGSYILSLVSKDFIFNGKFLKHGSY